MAIKKIRMRPEGTNDYVDVLHPETSASVVIEEANKRFMTDAERVKLTNAMVKSGGVLEDYTEKLVTTTGAINLSLGNVFTDTPSANRTYSITNAVSGQTHSFTLIITIGGTVRTLSFPASVKWQGGTVPDMTTANKTYVLTFMTVNGGATWYGMFGGEF